MRRTTSLNHLPTDKDFIVGFDLIGNIKSLFSKAEEMPGCLFLLCMRGSCTVTIHLHKFEITKNCIAMIFPGQFFCITDASPDCRFAFAGFDRKLAENPMLFTRAIKYAPLLFERPVIKLEDNAFSVFIDYFKVLIKASKLDDFLQGEQAQTICVQFIMAVGNLSKQNNGVDNKVHYNRNEEIVKDLVKIIIDNYKTERSISFYADKMHLSPQHLSTTIKKTTGKTLTDIISSFVIRDAQAKLKSTELTIQEIAYSLNFPDISFFGKYFKRYTGMSPKQFRNME